MEGRRDGGTVAVLRLSIPLSLCPSVSQSSVSPSLRASRVHSGPATQFSLTELMTGLMSRQLCDCRLVLTFVLLLGWATSAGSTAFCLAEEPSATFSYRQPRQLAKLANQEISESSGLAVSRRQAGVFWTHNDSGDSPRLFAFDSNGVHLGICRLQGAEAIDWEDLASFERAGKKWLLVADVGDNGKRRKSYQLYLCEEPSPDATEASAQRIAFRYERSSHDCEAVAVDPVGGVILLTTKVYGPVCQVYQLSIPDGPTSETLVAKRIAGISVPIVVSMNVSPDGLRAVVLTYGHAFEFSRAPDEDWEQGFARPPKELPMPFRRQGETICYGADGRTLYLTSESLPTPLWEVPWQAVNTEPLGSRKEQDR